MTYLIFQFILKSINIQNCANLLIQKEAQILLKGVSIYILFKRKENSFALCRKCLAFFVALRDTIL